MVCSEVGNKIKTTLLSPRQLSEIELNILFIALIDFSLLLKSFHVIVRYFNFEDSNPDNLRKLFAIYQDEANSLIGKNLTFPALDFVLKCSHCFNLLDSRGVISVTDRAQYIEKIRNLARKVASSWIAERELLNYPLIQK